MMRWRAVYNDGTHLEEDSRPGGAYAAIERHKLIRFELFADKYSILPFWSVEVPRGARLVWRERVISTPGVGRRVLTLVAIESADRSLVMVHALEPVGDQVKVQRADRYGNPPFDMPELLPEEVAA